MTANQYESNCEYMKIQNSENNSIANECCQTTNKIHSSNPCCNKDPILKQNHF